MPNILALLACLAPCLSSTTLRQMTVIIPALITMSGRVTMRGISRWTDKGGSYRSVQRFFQTVISWSQVFWLLFRSHILNSEDVYLLAGDETVVTKAGKSTHGLDRFFSRLYGKAIPGLSFFALSLVSIQQRRSYPVMVEQRVRSEAEKAAAKARKKEKKPKRGKKKSAKRKAGRRKGSKNKDKTQVELTPELHFNTS